MQLEVAVKLTQCTWQRHISESSSLLHSQHALTYHWKCCYCCKPLVHIFAFLPAFTWISPLTRFSVEKEPLGVSKLDWGLTERQDCVSSGGSWQRKKDVVHHFMGIVSSEQLHLMFLWNASALSRYTFTSCWSWKYLLPAICSHKY